MKESGGTPQLRVSGLAPEPWQALPHSAQSRGWYVRAADGTVVAAGVSRAHAEFIANAPELLEALRRLLPYENMAVIGDGTGTKDTQIRRDFAAARAAVAKAEGKVQP